MLAQIHGHDRCHGVRMVGRADGDGVDLVSHLVQQFAKGGELLRILEAGLCCHLVQGALVNVTDGNDLAVLRGIRRVAFALAAHTDASELDLLVGGTCLAEERATYRTCPESNPQRRAGL